MIAGNEQYRTRWATSLCRGIFFKVPELSRGVKTGQRPHHGSSSCSSEVKYSALWSEMHVNRDKTSNWWINDHVFISVGLNLISKIFITLQLGNINRWGGWHHFFTYCTSLLNQNWSIRNIFNFSVFHPILVKFCVDASANLYKKICSSVGRSICHNFLKFSENRPLSINQS